MPHVGRNHREKWPLECLRLGDTRLSSSPSPGRIGRWGDAERMTMHAPPLMGRRKCESTAMRSYAPGPGVPCLDREMRLAESSWLARRAGVEVGRCFSEDEQLLVALQQEEPSLETLQLLRMRGLSAPTLPRLGLLLRLMRLGLFPRLPWPVRRR